jgi:hypothetical protein
MFSTQKRARSSLGMADHCDHVPDKNRRDSGNYRLEALNVLKLALHYEQPENKGR